MSCELFQLFDFAISHSTVIYSIPIIIISLSCTYIHYFSTFYLSTMEEYWIVQMSARILMNLLFSSSNFRAASQSHQEKTWSHGRRGHQHRWERDRYAGWHRVNQRSLQNKSQFKLFWLNFAVVNWCSIIIVFNLLTMAPEMYRACVYKE